MCIRDRFGSAPDARGVAPSWSDASWLCVSDVPTLDGDGDGAPSDRDTAWAQVGPWGAFALVSAFRLETRVWNALRFEARASRPEFRVGWDLVDTSEQSEQSEASVDNTYEEDLASVASPPPDAPLATTTRRREKKKGKNDEACLRRLFLDGDSRRRTRLRRTTRRMKTRNKA